MQVGDDLGVVDGAQAGDAQARGLRLGGNDGQVLADQGVEERGLPDVGSAGEDDGSAAGHGRKATTLDRNVKQRRLADPPSGRYNRQSWTRRRCSFWRSRW